MGPCSATRRAVERCKEEKKMRKELFLVSLTIAAVVALLCQGKASFYLMLLSLAPLIYAYFRERRAPLFPLVLGAAFVFGSFTYPWHSLHIIILSIMWPAIFGLFALHSVPESPEMEKNVMSGCLLSSFISFSFLYFLPGMIGAIPNAGFLVLIGLIAGIAMAYLAWK